MARPVTLFTGQWADLSIDELAGKCGEWGFDGLELACWGDHFDVAKAMSDSGYAAGRGAAREPGSAAGRSATTSSARRSATRSTTPPGRALARGLGRRRPRGRQRAAEAMKDTARGGPARRRRRHRLHRLADLAHALLVPAQRLRRDRARLPGVRRALGADHRRVRVRGRRSRSRSTRPRSPTTSSPRARRSTRSATGRASGSTSTRATSSTSSSTRRRSSPSSPEDLPRAHQGLGQAAGRALVDPRRPPELRRAGPRLGLRLAGARRRRLRA